MANQTIKTPRFYPDLISYHRARGASPGIVKSDIANTLAVQTGSAGELFDLRPLNQVTFDTSANTSKHVLTNFSFTTASYKQNYIAILNHNLNSAGGRFKIFAGNEASNITALDGGNADTADINWSSVNATEIVNADTIAASDSNKTVTVTPASDGTTVLTFDEQDLRYWAIQFEGDTSWDGSTDFIVGSIMIGEYFDMPFSPDLNLTRSIIYDKVNVAESAGGQRYATATSFGRTASSTSKSPFTLGTYAQNVYGGRQAYDLTYSYLQDSDLLPNEYPVYQHGNDSVVSDVWNMVDGPSRPFIFSLDNTSTGANAESEHLFARFAHNSLDMQQVAPDVYTVGTRIEEEF